MKQIISRLRRFHLVRPLLAASLGLAALVAVGAPASAHERDHGRDWRAHDSRAHDWRHDDWRWHRPAFFGAFAPAPVYVPEPTYYAPAPVYAPPAASFNLVVPLRFR
jgi:hypothetical protein